MPESEPMYEVYPPTGNYVRIRFDAVTYVFRPDGARELANSLFRAADLVSAGLVLETRVYPSFLGRLEKELPEIHALLTLPNVRHTFTPGDPGELLFESPYMVLRFVWDGWGLGRRLSEEWLKVTGNRIKVRLK